LWDLYSARSPFVAIPREKTSLLLQPYWYLQKMMLLLILELILEKFKEQEKVLILMTDVQAVLLKRKIAVIMRGACLC
jgi:hypothetical protein